MNGEIFRVGAEDLRSPSWMAAAAADLEHTYYWSDDWSPGFYIDLATAGFISIAMPYHDPEGRLPPWLLLPELQQAYAVLDWQNLRFDGAVRRLLEGPVSRGELRLTQADSIAPVLDALQAYHRNCWIHPPYRQMLLRLEQTPHPRFRLAAFELRHPATGSLIAGELGYFLGSTYTSLTGFFRREDPRWNHHGKLQLVLLARRLQADGCAFWNLGHPTMAYKTALGARILEREAFLQRWSAAVDARPQASPG